MSQNILIVESEPWLGDHYQRIFEKHGFSVDRASHAYAAIDIIDEKPPVAIVMSLMLNGPGALALLHELQSYVDTGSIPVVVCTSLSQVTLEELQPYGVQRLIDSASMQPNDVVGAVRSVLYQS